jgi:hypothetical protein
VPDSEQILDDQLLAQAQRARQARIALARRDPNTFIELVMRDEASGRSVEQASCHLAWQNAIDVNQRVLLFAHIESGKTNNVAIGRALYEIGKNPNVRIAIVSNTYHQAEKLVRTVGGYVESGTMAQLVFPNLKPSLPWTSSHITVERPSPAKDPTVQACGVHGNILGARIDFLILDDILDYENTLTARQRQDMWDWYHSTLAGRLTENARVVAIGTAWHPDDIYHRFERQPGWHTMRFPVLDEVTNEPTWPERWSKKRIAAKRSELGPLEFSRQLLCKARDDSESRFKETWIKSCLDNGNGLSTVQSWEEIMVQQGITWASNLETEERREVIEGAARLLSDTPEISQELYGACYTGVDLAVQSKESSDESVIFTIYVGPNKKRQVVQIRSGKWTGPEIVDRIISTHERFNSIVVVENNASQDFILQFVRERGCAVPLVPFTTGRNKAHPAFGIESIAAEFAAGLWSIPSTDGKPNDPEVAKWIEEMLYYDPKGHTGDRLMASWFARELARRAAKPITKVSTRVIG